uniref:Uncharacterized protein n=1 Tax=Schlesneria paludicola TaxID=360056 RepID=A0A7C4LKX9_9PLAN
MAAGVFDNSSLPDDLDARVRAEIRAGERLVWVGQPRPGRLARGAIPIVLFGIPWTAFAVFWMAAASGALFGGFGENNGPGEVGGFFTWFPLFGLPFVLIGLGMLSSPYWFWRQAKRTCYALTDHRAILWQANPCGGVTVRSYGPEALDKIHRTEYADGCGDLVFEEAVSVGWNSKGHRTTTTTRYGFMAIDNVREVEELLRRVLLPGGDH